MSFFQLYREIFMKALKAENALCFHLIFLVANSFRVPESNESRKTIVCRKDKKKLPDKQKSGSHF